MTSWQDQPPLTRRQARENQRAAERESSPAASGAPVSRRAATMAPTTAGEVPAVATPYSFSSAQRGTGSGQAPADAAPTRPHAPRYEELSFDNLLAASHAGGPVNGTASSEHVAAPVAAPVSYTPPLPSAPAEQRQSPPFRSGSASPFAAEESAVPEPWTPPGKDSTDESSASVSSSAAPASAAPVTARGMAIAPDGHLLTRRELRAMMQAQAAGGTPADVDAGSAAPVVPASEGAMATLDPVPERESADETAGHVVRPAAPAARAASSTPISAVSTSAAASSAVPSVLPEGLLPEAVAGNPVPAPGRAGNGPVRDGDGVSRVPTVAGPATDPQLVARGAGHWSTMNEDEPAVSDAATPRSAVSTGTVTTANALILPTVPSVGLAGSPLTSTGEVIVTGSIDLPRSLGSTGQHPDHFDSSDIDRLFEETDAAPATTGVAPVRASKAVATHTSTRGMMAAPRARGNKLPVVLAVTAAFLALGVAALLVAGYVFHAF